MTHTEGTRAQGADAWAAWTEANRAATEGFTRATEAGLEMTRTMMGAFQAPVNGNGNPSGAVPRPTPAPSGPMATGTPFAPPFGNVGATWMRIMQEASERTREAMSDGRGITPDLYTDLWTRGASEFAKEVLEDPAFARMAGQTAEGAATARHRMREEGANRARDMGLAAHDDVVEIGERLIELERRIHDLTWLIRDHVVDTGAGTRSKRSVADSQGRARQAKPGGSEGTDPRTRAGGKSSASAATAPKGKGSTSRGSGSTASSAKGRTAKDGARASGSGASDTSGTGSRDSTRGSGSA